MFRETTFSDLDRTRTLSDADSVLLMDEETFRAFYDRNARGLWAYLAKVTSDRQLADDLLQETFYRFLRAAATHDDESHRRNSLYRIATNLARDNRRRSLIRSISSPAGNDIERFPSTRPVMSEQAADLNRAMENLKPRERAMLWLAYAEGASHREIAAVLGLSPRSLKPLLFRARKTLAALLGKRTGGKQ